MTPRLFRRACVLLSAAILSGGTPALGATLPAGFVQASVGGLSKPTAMAIAPDGRVFVCEQDGDLRVIKNGVLLGQPFLSVPAQSDGERGLLGIAFHPHFPATPYVYVYYTAKTPFLHNRVSRFTASGDVAVPGSEEPILDLEELSASNHNGGAIHFGPDDKLYVAVGENAHGPNSQSLNNRLGKILRINPDGTIPTDNPTAFNGISGTTSGASRAIWAVGLRNPYTFAFQRGTNRMFINDVGENRWEEINDGHAGANYGWPDSEGATPNGNFVSPLYFYPNDADTCAISGAAFYTPLTYQFPAAYAGTYFFADLCGGWLRRLDPASNVVTEFATDIDQPVDLAVADDGSLYYLAREGDPGGSGLVVRVTYNNPGGPTPVAPTLASYVNGLTVALWWTPSAGATSYVLEAGSAAGMTDIAVVDLGNTTTFQQVVPAGTYFARVRAVNGSGPGVPSNQVMVEPAGARACVTPPPPPTALAASVSGAAVSLSWNPSPSADEYVLEAGSAPGQADVYAAKLGAVTAFATTAPSGLYYTRVRAANACGLSEPSIDVPVTVGCGRVAAPNLTVTRTGSLVTFSWNTVLGAQGYRAQIGTAQDLANLVNMQIGSATTQVVDISGVAPGTYYVRILANMTCGSTGPASNEAIVQVP